MDGKQLLDAVGNEINELTRAASDSRHTLPELQFARTVLSANIRVTNEPHSAASPADSNLFYLDSVQRTLHWSDAFTNAWLSMRQGLYLNDVKLSSALRAFLLHELFHINQRLTSPRHYDARLAPTSTQSIDYFADMSAAIASFYLHSDQVGPWQPRFALAMEGVWLAMYVFKFMTTETEIKLLRFKRYFLTHYQYHRCRNHRGANPTRMQLLFYPAVDFNGISSGEVVNETRLLRAYAETNETFMWLVAPDEKGMPRLIRTKPQQNRIAALATGIFTGDLLQSHSYFEYIFSAEDSLLGGLGGYQPDQPITRYMAGQPAEPQT